MKLILDIENFFLENKMRSGLLLFIGAAAFLTISLLDYVTGPGANFSIFYALLSVYITWFFGARSGCISGIVLGFYSVYLDHETGHYYLGSTSIAVWAFTWRSLMFVLADFLVNRLHLHLKRQEEANRNLKAAYELVVFLSKSKSDFVDMVTHELRTPLTAIKESVRLVADESVGTLNDEQKDYLEMTARNITRLGRLVDNVLLFSKANKPDMELNPVETDLRALLKDVCELHTVIAAKKNIQLICEIRDDLPGILVDPDAVSQIMNNLINNAIKFTPSGKIVVSLKETDRNVHIFVQDSGPGIPRECHQEIFQPFRQLSLSAGTRPEGTGLGLAISQTLAELLKGKLTVESNAGEGSTFCLTLPNRKASSGG